ncbi:MAG TPA: CNNM domain-containing protein, partial [Solirubrobacteraceae bacterium]|nr:CNNM domain-containing protein [Solirubrobacteraceae bacterium]
MTALALVGVVILVLLNGFFVAAEFALVRVRRSRLEEDASAGDRRAQLTLRILDELSAYLAACQVGITFTSLGIGFLGEPAIGRLFEQAFGDSVPHWVSYGVSLALAYLITTSLHITIGEQVPKIYSIEKAEQTALRISR